jgi:hypothetical protein
MSLEANEDGEFVTIPGREWAKQEGDACILRP